MRHLYHLILAAQMRSSAGKEFPKMFLGSYNRFFWKGSWPFDEGIFLAKPSLWMWIVDTDSGDTTQSRGAAEMWHYHRINWISYTKHVSNEVVLQRIGMKRELLLTIKMQQKTLLSRVIRQKKISVTVEGSQAKKEEEVKGRHLATTLKWWPNTSGI